MYSSLAIVEALDSVDTDKAVHSNCVNVIGTPHFCVVVYVREQKRQRVLYTCAHNKCQSGLFF